MADFVLLVAARTGEDVDQRARSTYRRKGNPGFEWPGARKTRSARAAPSHALFRRPRHLPAEAMLGDEETGFRVAMAAPNDFRCASIIGRGRRFLPRVRSTTPSSSSSRAGIPQRSRPPGRMDDRRRWRRSRPRSNLASMSSQVDAGGSSALRPAKATLKCHATDTAMKVATDAAALEPGGGRVQRISDQQIFPRREGARSSKAPTRSAQHRRPQRARLSRRPDFSRFRRRDENGRPWPRTLL